MEPPALAAGPVAPVRAAPGASADLVLPPPKGTQPFAYHWSRAGASLDDRFTTSEDAGGIRLTVSAAQTGDSGVYTLQASNAAGSATSKIRLEVAAEEAPTGEDPPTFLRRLQDLTVKVGSRTRFLVEIISSTECKVTWYRNERRLLEAERVALARDGNFWCADVAAVSVDDAGRWTCTAENAGGRASCSAHLNVLVPKAYKRPEFVEELRALLTEQGTVSLECKVVGVPTPVLRWFKDSREIKAGDVFALTANAEDPTSLGTYTCEAVNCMGRAYSSSKVHVVGRASREGSARPSSSGITPEPPPIFTKELEDAHVNVCESLTLGCHIVVPPWPRSVVWYNKEGKVEPGERYHVLEDGVGGYLLEILSTEWADEGEWKCVATSAGGRVGITTCYVAMDVPKNYRKPRFMENLQAVLTEEGLVSFECKVVGFPTPVLSWFKDGQELKPGDVYQLTGTNSLGSYCCMARNCMGQASSSAELTIEDIQNQLNEEEKLQLFSKNQAPKFLQGLKSVEAKIDEPFRFTIKVAIPPEPSVLWYRDDQPVDESIRCHLEKEDKGLFNLDIQNLEFLDQAEWKCVAMNDFGHSVTSCFLKLIIPRHYKKPRFLENLQAILSDEGAVNLECKVIGVPQPVLKWYKDGEELKPGDIHRIISGQDGTCCLGTYTCEAQNCMGIAASSASLLGFDDSLKTKTKTTEEQPLQRNLSLSTIHEERTSQMYDTPVGDITQIDDKGEISFSFDGKEVSVSLYETPDLTEEEALQIVEMYADQLSENVTEHNVVELPPLRFVKETSTSGNLLMEAIIIDVSPDYFAAPDEDLRTEADVEDLSIADENGLIQLSLDQDIEIGGEDYLEKTMALLSEDKSDFAAKSSKRKSDSQRSADDFFSLSRDQSLSDDKRDDDTHVSESELQSFASARSSAKVKSKSSRPSGEEGQESSEPTKTIVLKEQTVTKLFKNEETKQLEQELEVPIIKPKRERRTSRGSRRSSTSSEKSIGKSREELIRLKTDHEHSLIKTSMSDEEFKNTMFDISTSLTKVINDVQLIERDIILKSELMSSAATASRSLEIIGSLITPLSEIHSIADAAKESVSESREVTSTIFNSIPQPLKALQQSLTIIEKCIDMESDNKTLVKKTCVAFIETCGAEVQKVINGITSVTAKHYIKTEDKVISEIDSVASEMIAVIKFSAETIRARNLLTEASEIKHEKLTIETKHLRDTQKAVFELKSPLNSLLRIVKSAESGNITDLPKIKQCEVIMNDMSASIQDLQTALEQIEFLSVKESSATLHKYNTEIIETVMDPILKLRGSFEQLSTELHTEEDKTVLQETLKVLKENLTEISYKIETIDKNVGQFDILQSENKLDVLQKMAQILIALENNLLRLETMPTVKSYMDTFHKNLTKVLEKVIESNDAKKYLSMMEICDTVNIINCSIKNLGTENVLPLASISNTLKTIQINLVENIFEPELNCSIINNISDILMGIQEAINKAEEISLQTDSECIQDLSIQSIDEAKVNIILEHIDQTIAAVNTIKTIESLQELKLALTPALENICPILEELRRSVASVRPSGVEQDEHISEILEASFAQTIATPLCELNQNIIVLNQLIVENIDYIKDSTEVMTAIAEPLHELHTTLEILQQDVISQYGDDLTPYEVSINMASVVHNLQSCIVMIQEQAGIEGTEEMSTLEDISGIKTSADTVPSDCLVLPAAEETAIEQSVLPFTHEIAITATAKTLQTLNEHIMVLQTPEIIEALDTLSEMSDCPSLKSVIVGLGDLHSGIEGILHPVPIEGSTDLDETINISKLTAIAEPMQIIHQGLSVFDTSNIPVYENILDLPPEKIHSVFQTISELKNALEQCMCAVLPAMEITNNTIEISNKVSTLREVCKQLNDIFATTKDAQTDLTLPKEVQNLEIIVNNLIDATDTSKDMRIDQVKYITEELYTKVMGIQEDIIQFTAQSPERISQEAKLIQIVSDVETNIAILEQYDFIDLSRASDITACTSPKIATEIDSESLVQIDDIAEDAVNILQDYYQEIPAADLIIVEDFFKTCKNEFTILRCLISKAPSHKKIIRLLQEFNSLQTLINDFTTKRFELFLSDDVNDCLTNFLIHADECLRNARISLVKIVDSQTGMLIKTPITQLESIRELKYPMESNTSTAIVSVMKLLEDIAETSKSLANNLQSAIIQELTQPNQPPKPQQEEKALMDKMEHFANIINTHSEHKNLDDSSSRVFEKLALCIKNHHVYKDASGTGKTLIILKCLAECSTIVQEEVTKKKLSINETTEIQETENSLKEVLAEMLQPLQALQNQLVSIREQVLSGAEEDSISIDITTTESIMQTMAELHKDIVQQIGLDKSALHNEDIALIEEVDKEIHTIQDSIKSMGNVQAAQAVKEITKPMEAIEKSLHTVISAEKDKETLPKETSTNLIRYLDQYIELIEIVEEISAVITIEKVNETFDIAKELRENIAAYENEQNKELISIARTEETRLAQKLQMALSALQIQVLDSAQELAPTINANTLQRIAHVTAQLQANLGTVTGIQIGGQTPSTKTTSFIETAQKLSVSATTSESVETDTKSFEQVGTLDKEIPREHVILNTEILENIATTSQETEIVEEVKLEQENSKKVAEVSSQKLVDTESTVESEAQKDSFTIIDSSETVTTPVTAEMHAESAVGSHALETQQLAKEKIKITLSTAQENLMQHISEYVAEDIVQAIDEVSSIMNIEEIKHSIIIAKQLGKCIAAADINRKEKCTLDVIKDQHDQQEELAVGLTMALSVLSDDTLEHLHELIPSVNKNTIEKVVKTIQNLKTELAAIKISQQKMLQPTKRKQENVETKSEHVKKDIEKSSLKIFTAGKKDNVTVGEESTNFMPVATSPISLISTESSGVLTETNAMIQELAITQDTVSTAEKHETTETQKEFAEKLTVTLLQEETKHTLPLRTEENTVKTLNQASVIKTEELVEEYSVTAQEELKHTLPSRDDEDNFEYLDQAPVTKTDEIRQEKTSVEEHSNDAILTQEVHSFQITREMSTTAAKSTEVENAVSAPNISEQVLTLETAEISLPVATDEKIAEVSLTSGLVTQDELVTDAHQAVNSDINATVSTAMAIAGQSTDSTAHIMPQVTQASEKSEVLAKAAKETLTQTINAFCSDVVLHTVCEQSLNSEEFNKAVQIAKDLQQYIITLKLNTADELKNKLCSNLEQADITLKLQQALTFIKAQLLDNVSETSFSLSNDLKSVVYIITLLNDQLSVALSIETVPKIANLDIKEDALKEIFQENKTEYLNENINKNGDSIKNPKDSLEVTDKFVDCSGVFSTYKNTGDFLCQEKSLETNIAETITIETTKPFQEFFDSPTLADELLSAESIAMEVGETNIFENINYAEKNSETAKSAHIGLSDSFVSAVTMEIIAKDVTKMINDKGSTNEEIVLHPESLTEVATCNQFNGKENTIQQKLSTQKLVTVYSDVEPVIMQSETVNQDECLPLESFANVNVESFDQLPLAKPNTNFETIDNVSMVAQEAPIASSLMKVIQTSTENVLTDTPLERSSNLHTTSDSLPLVKLTTSENVEITASRDSSIYKELERAKPVTVSESDSSYYAVIDEVNVNEATEVINKENSSNNIVTLSSEVNKPQLEVTISSKSGFKNTMQQNYTQESSAVCHHNAETVLTQDHVIAENKSTSAIQLSFLQLPTVHIECSNIIQHIDAFISDEVIEIVNEISNITNTETLKDSVAVAKKLRECVLATDYNTTEEETTPSPTENVLSEQAHLAHILQEALSSWHTQALDHASVIAPIIRPSALQKVSEIISHLQDGLAIANVSDEAENINIINFGDVATKEPNSIDQLETLLQDVTVKINLASSNSTMDTEDSESLKDTLDEVQTVIIKLKREYDGTANDTLNETLEDLECSVRSVQLQINEESPPELLAEAYATLQLLVDNMNAIQVHVPQVLLEPEGTGKVLEKCSNETEGTVKLLDIASKLDTKGSSNLTSIVSNLKAIKNNLKYLRESFLVDVDTVIENGVNVIECLNQVEDNIFSLEREVDMAGDIVTDTRDSIITAIHSVYSSISNMRSTVSSVQKQFMFENYGKPSESLLHSIKNITFISSTDDENNRPCWKKMSKSLRKVLNHFEDIKFYINLDKTARLPSDAAFTKIILEELKDNINSVLVPRAKHLDPYVLQNVNDLLKCVETNFMSIESDSRLQVKNKIPMFKDIATEMLATSVLLKTHLQNLVDTTEIINEGSELPDVKNRLKDELLDSKQEHQELAITTEKHQAESITTVSEMTKDSLSKSIVDMISITEFNEVKPTEENILTTINLVTDKMPNTSINLDVTKAEISSPLEKQELVAEANVECLSEIIKNELTEIKNLSSNSEKHILLEAEENLTQSHISQVILETSGTLDFTLQATTSKQGYTEMVEEVKEEAIKSQAIESANENGLKMEIALVTFEKEACSRIMIPVTQIHEESFEQEQDESASHAKTSLNQTEKLCEKEPTHEMTEDLLKHPKESYTEEEVAKTCVIRQESKANEEEESKLTEEFLEMKTGNSQSKIVETLSYEQLELKQLESATATKENNGTEISEKGTIKSIDEASVAKQEVELQQTKEVAFAENQKKKDTLLHTNNENSENQQFYCEQTHIELNKKESKDNAEDKQQIEIKQTEREKQQLIEKVETATTEQDFEITQTDENPCALKVKQEDDSVEKIRYTAEAAENLQEKSKQETDEMCIDAERKGNAELKEKEKDIPQTKEQGKASKVKQHADLNQKHEALGAEEMAKNDKEPEREEQAVELEQKEEETPLIQESDASIKHNQENQVPHASKKNETDESKHANKFIKKEEQEQRDEASAENEQDVSNAKQVTEFKQKDKQETHDKKEKGKKNKEVEKVIQEAELKENEGEARALKDMVDNNLKLKEQQIGFVKNENIKNNKEDAEKVKQEDKREACNKHEKDDIALKEPAKLAQQNVEEIDKVKQETVLKQKEESTNGVKKIPDADLKLNKEQGTLADLKNSKNDEQKEEKVKREAESTQKQEETHALTEKADAARKINVEQEKLAKSDKEDVEKMKQEAKSIQKEENTRTEKADADVKQNKEPKVLAKQNKEEAKKVKQEAELKQKEEEALAIKEKTDTDIKYKLEQEILSKIDKEESDKIKTEAELKQKEEQARELKKKADDDRKFKKEQEPLVNKEKAEREKAEADKIKLEAELQHKEEEELALRGKADVDLKFKGEQETLVNKEKEEEERKKQEVKFKLKDEEAHFKHVHDDADHQQKEKQKACSQEDDLEKLKEEATKENDFVQIAKAETDYKHKEQEDTSGAPKEEALAEKDNEEVDIIKQEAELKQKEEEARALNEKAEADQILKKEQESLVNKEKAEREKAEVDKVKLEAVLQQKQEVAQVKKEKAKIDQEEVEKVKLEEIKQKEEETRVLKQKSNADIKLKHEQEALVNKEKSEKEEAEADKLKLKAELQQKEEVARALKEKADTDLTHKEEQKVQAEKKEDKKNQEEAEKLNLEIEIKQKEEEARALKKKADADLKHKEEQKAQAEKKKAKKDQVVAEKLKLEEEIKQKEEEARALKEKSDADLNLKKEHDALVNKEKAEREKAEADNIKLEAELQQKEEVARALKEKADADLKHKEEQKAQAEKEKTKKHQEEAEKVKLEEIKQKEEKALKEKADADLRLKQEQEALVNKEKAEREKAEADKLKLKAELQQKEEVARVLKEKADIDLTHKEEQKAQAEKKNDKKNQDEAEKSKLEIEIKQKEEKARALKEKADADLKHKEEQTTQAEKKKNKKNQEEAEKSKLEIEIKQKEEKARALKEKSDADLKHKEEQTTQAEKKKANKDQEVAEKLKLEEEIKQKEEELRALKEKSDADLNLKKEHDALVNKEKAEREKAEADNIKLEAELKQKKEVARAQKEKADADLKNKEEQKAQAEKEKAKKKQEAEKLKLEIEIKHKEKEARVLKEKAEADLKHKEEQKTQAEKEKAKKDQEEAEKVKLEIEIKQKEKEDADLRLKNEQESLVNKEKGKREKAEVDKIKLESELQEETRVLKEKSDADIRIKQEQEAHIHNEKSEREKAEALKIKLEAELQQKDEVARAQKEKADADIKHKRKQETQAKNEKAKNDQEEAEKVKLGEIKQKEEETRALKEKADADLILQKEQEALVNKEKAETEKVKLEAELQQKEEEARALNKKADADLKNKEEQEALNKKEKAKRDIGDAEKLKQTTELKQKEEEARVLKEKVEKELFTKRRKSQQAKKGSDEAVKAKQTIQDAHVKEESDNAEHNRKATEENDTSKVKQDAVVIQKKEQETRVEKEKDITDYEMAEEVKQEAELKQKEEARALKKGADSSQNHKKVENTELRKEKEDVEHKQITEEKERAKKEKPTKALKETMELKQNQEEKERVIEINKEAELLQKQEKVTKIEKVDELYNIRRKSVKKNEEALKKVNKDDERNVDISQIENKVITSHDVEELSKKKLADEISKKSKYTERLDKGERREDEFHIYKEDSNRQVKKENGDINPNRRGEVSHEQRYFREYQYEPSPTGHKMETREKPRFVDHTHRDYTMEFARPSGYREKSFDVDKTDNLPVRDHLSRNAAICKAQTLLLDSQLRSSSPLHLDPDTGRTSVSTDRRSEIRHRSTAHSEAKINNSDKRTVVSRDSKRKPVFSTYLTDRTAVEGSRVKLTCSVLSSSDPTVTWYKNGVLLDNKLKYRTKFMDGLITLEVLNAVPSDSAEYSCTIQNENGSVSSSANLKVYPSFEASPIPPTFTRSIRDTFHLAENELVLECRIRGQPLPTITWLKDEKSVSNNSRYQAYYLADGVCRLAIEHPTPEDSGKYTCKAENSVWSDQITHVVNFTGKESRLGPNIATLEKSRFNRQALESRRPHFTNVLSDYKVATGGTIGLQVEIRGAPTRVEWLREGCSVTEIYRNAKTFVEQGLYTLALSDVTEKESGMYTCRAWNSQCHVDMNAAITVVQPNELDGKPAVIVGRPEKDILISVGEDVNISFRVQGEPKPKVVFMKGIRDITTSQRVCKMTSDDYVKFTLKRSVVSDAGTYCILARNAYGCDRAFVTVVVRQRASSDNLISDWIYPTDDSTQSTADRKYKSVPERIPGEPCILEGGNNWISLGWPKSERGPSAPVLAYKVESWLLGKEGGARWIELGITPLNSFDAFNLKQGAEYHFRVTPRNRYGWGESVQTSTPVAVGLAGDRPEFSESLPGQLKVLVGETANLSCSVKGTPAPEVVWMKNGHEIEDEDRRISSSFNGFNCNLTIKDINIEDEARYSCEAANVHGRASTYARLAVVTDRSIWEADAKLKRERSAGVEGDYPPQFTMRLRDRRVQATYPVRLTCQVIGSPDPRITWFKDGGEVTPDSRRSHFQDEHFHTLEIAPTTLEDGGVYEAMARNSSGAVSCRCGLVVDKGIRAYVAPEFCCGLEPLYRLTDGEELRISAVVEAYPSVGVTWYRDGVRLRPSRRAIMTLDRDGQIELALAAVTSRDAGVYSCTASNEVGSASTSGKVEVTGTNVTRTLPVFISPDEPYSKEPMFIRKPRSSEAREGDTVIIACEVVGDPKPDVYWLRDFLKPDYYRDSSHFKRMGDGPEYRFEIPHAKLDYTGAYSVVARNQHGEAKAVISLQILAKDPASGDEAHNVRYGLVEVLPRFSKELTDLLSCDGDAVEFECRLSGHPEPYVRWFHYHELIRECSDFETSFDEGTARLKIKQVTAEDEGTYTCEATNNLGKAKSSACLVVYPPGEPNTLSQRLRRPPAFLSAASTPRSTPRSTPARSVSRTPGPETRRLCSPARTLAPAFYTYPFNKVAEEGDAVTLQCAIKGNPAPWATWDKDGVIITPSSRITIKEKDDVLRVLEIDQVTIDDVGVYRITIENELGRQEASARIEVITQKGKFYAGVRAASPSPRKSLTYRGRRPSTPRQD